MCGCVGVIWVWVCRGVDSHQVFVACVCYVGVWVYRCVGVGTWICG